MKIELKNIKFEPEKKVVIDDISLKIDAGITTFLGQNGSGKTTLMKMISNITDQTSGEIFVNNQNITRLSRNYLSKTLSYVSPR